MNYMNYRFDQQPQQQQQNLDASFNNLSFNQNYNQNKFWNNNNNHNNNSSNSNTNNGGSNSTSNKTNNSNSGNVNGSTSGNRTDIDSLKLDIQIKDTQIESLENEIQNLKSILNSNINDISKASNSDDDTVQIPKNLEIIFKKLSMALTEKDEELIKTKNDLESLITAIALDPSNSITKNGRFDIETVAHKLIVRLEILTKENNEMSKMLSYGRAKETQIELNLVKKENSELKEKIAFLEQKLNESKK